VSWREEIIGDARLILADCRDVLPTLGKVDAVCCDPPYGQGYKVNTFYKGGTRENAVVQRNGKTLQLLPTVHAEIKGDAEPFDPTHLLGLAPVILIWGAHKFADRLPRGSWLIWDKVPTGKLRSQGDGEAAWLSTPDKPMRIFRLLWDGLCVGKGARHEVTAGQKRLHPMQKPEILMSWCLDFTPGETVLDPYMGSGSTGIAALKAGRKFIGIESEESYFEIACERIADAHRNAPRLFAEPVAKPVQPSLLDPAA
jgi:site-specific DNA-methyltransferase (adenine-specific)